MSLTFDTAILIELQKRNEQLEEKIAKLRAAYPALPSITFITYFEFIYGLEDVPEKQKVKDLEFIESFNLLQITKNTAKILSRIKKKYAKMGQLLSLSDFLVASQVMENKMILVTTDKDFKIIEELDKIII